MKTMKFTKSGDGFCDSFSRMGKYAYWLAAGFDANADAETTENVIALFCGEKESGLNLVIRWQKRNGPAFFPNRKIYHLLPIPIDRRFFSGIMIT